MFAMNYMQLALISLRFLKCFIFLYSEGKLYEPASDDEALKVETTFTFKFGPGTDSSEYLYKYQLNPPIVGGVGRTNQIGGTY